MIRRDEAPKGRRGRGRTETARRVAGAVVCAALLSFTGGCVHVKLDPPAEAVGVVKTEAEVADCKKRSDIRSKTVARIALIPRNETTIALELERLARNEAVRFGGNTILPLGPVSEEGERTYANYICPE